MKEENRGRICVSFNLEKNKIKSDSRVRCIKNKKMHTVLLLKVDMKEVKEEYKQAITSFEEDVYIINLLDVPSSGLCLAS